MREHLGDMWALTADAYCIATNCEYGRDTRAIMGAGQALEAKLKYPGVDIELGAYLHQTGGRPRCLILQYADDIALVNLPTKLTVAADSPLWLVAKSVAELVQLTDEQGWTTVALPRPGCGYGGLDWTTQVQPLLTLLLDDRFIVCHK